MKSLCAALVVLTLACVSAHAEQLPARADAFSALVTDRGNGPVETPRSEQRVMGLAVPNGFRDTRTEQPGVRSF